MMVDDIYEDLEHFDFSEEVLKLREENKTLLDQICTLKNDNKSLSEKYTLLEKEAKELRTNISSLHKTSTSELQRKERIIQELREKVDSFIYKRDISFNNRNANHDKYPPDEAVANRRESHLSDTTVFSNSSNQPNTQDRHTSKQTLCSRNINQERFLPEKAIVKCDQVVTRHNSCEEALDYNIDCNGNEGQLSAIPNLRVAELENAVCFEPNNITNQFNEGVEIQNKYLKSFVKTEIEEAQHTYIRNKIEERRIELTKLEFEKDYSEAESMLQLKNLENKPLLLTPPRQCLSPRRNAKLSLDRGDSLKQIHNKTRSRSRSCEKNYKKYHSQKSYKRKSRSPYRNTESKRFRRDPTHSGDRKKKHHDTKYRFEKYGNHHEQHDRDRREDENKHSSRRSEWVGSERNDKYIKTSAERLGEYQATSGADKDDFRKKRFSPVHTKNISTITFKNNSSDLDVKIQSKEREYQKRECRIRTETSAENSDSRKRSSIHDQHYSRTVPKNKSNKDIQRARENSRKDKKSLVIKQKSVAQNPLPIDISHRGENDSTQENALCTASDDMEEGEIVTDDHINDVKCISTNTVAYTNKNKTHHLEESSNCVKKSNVINSSSKRDSPSSSKSTGILNLPVEKSYNANDNKSDQIKESSSCVKKLKVINSSSKCDNPRSTNKNNINLLGESSDYVKNLKDTNSSKCDNPRSTKSSGDLSLPEENSGQSKYNTNENKSYHSEKSSEFVKKPKAINSSSKHEIPSSTKSIGNLSLPVGNSVQLDKINSSQTALNTNENKIHLFGESSDNVKKSKDIHSSKCDNLRLIESSGNVSLPVENSGQVACNTIKNTSDHSDESSQNVKKPKDIHYLKCDNSRSTKSFDNLDSLVENLDQTPLNTSDHSLENSNYVKKPKAINSSLKHDNSSSNKLTDDLSLNVGKSALMDQINSSQKAYNKNKNKFDLFGESSDYVKKHKNTNSSTCENPRSIKATGDLSLPGENSGQSAYNLNENNSDSSGCVNTSNSSTKHNIPSLTKLTGNLSIPVESSDQEDQSHTEFSINENKIDFFRERSDNVNKPKDTKSSKSDNPRSFKASGNSSLTEENSDQTACKKIENIIDLGESSDYVKKPKDIHSSKCDKPILIKSSGNLSLPVENSDQAACNSIENKSDHSDESSHHVKKPKDINYLKCDNSRFIKSSDNFASLVENLGQTAFKTNDHSVENSNYVKKPKPIDSSLKRDTSSSNKSTDDLSLNVGKSALMDQINSSQKANNKNQHKFDLFGESSDYVKKHKNTNSSTCENPRSNKATDDLSLSGENSGQSAYKTNESKSDCSDYVKKPNAINSSTKEKKEEIPSFTKKEEEIPSSTKSTGNLSLPVESSDQRHQSKKKLNTNENKIDLFGENSDNVNKLKDTKSLKCHNPRSIKSSENLSLSVEDSVQKACNINENKGGHHEKSFHHVKKPKVNNSSNNDNSRSSKSSDNLALLVENSGQKEYNTNDHSVENSDYVKKPKAINSSLKRDNSSSTKSTDDLSLNVEKSALMDQINSSQKTYNTNENKTDLFEGSPNYAKKHRETNSLKCESPKSTISSGDLSLPGESSGQSAHNRNEKQSYCSEKSSEYVKKPKAIINSSSNYEIPSSIKSTGNLSLPVENSVQPDQINSSQTALNTNENKMDLFEESYDYVKKDIRSLKCDNSRLNKSSDNLSLPVEDSGQKDCNISENKIDHTEKSSDYVKKPNDTNFSKCDNSRSTESSDNLNLLVKTSGQTAYNTNENENYHIEENLQNMTTLEKPIAINSSLKHDNTRSINTILNISLPVETLNQQDKPYSSQTEFNRNENIINLFGESPDYVKKPKVTNSSQCVSPSSTKSFGNLSLQVENSTQLDKINSRQMAYKINENKREHFDESSDNVKKPKVHNFSLKYENPSSSKSSANISLSVENSVPIAYNINENKSDHFEESPVKKPKIINSSSKCGNPSSTKSTDNSSLSFKKPSYTANNTNENKSDLFEESSVSVMKLNTQSLICDNLSSTKSTDNLPVGNSAYLDQVASCQIAHKINENKSNKFDESSSYVEKSNLVRNSSSKCCNSSLIQSADNLSLPVGNSTQLNKTAYNTNENKSDYFEESSDSVKKPKVINSSNHDNPSSTKSTDNLSLPVENSSHTVYNLHENKSDHFRECSDHANKSEVTNSSPKCGDYCSGQSAGNLSSPVGNSAQPNPIDSSRQRVLTKLPRKFQHSFSEPSKTVPIEKSKTLEKSCEQGPNTQRTHKKERSNASKDITKSALKSDVSDPKVSVSVQGNTDNTLRVKVFRQRTIIKKLN